MKEYDYYYEPAGEKRGCSNCGCQVPLALYEGMLTQNGVHNLHLCRVCAETHLAKATTYPRQCCDTALYKSIAIIANMILEKIK